MVWNRHSRALIIIALLVIYETSLKSCGKLILFLSSYYIRKKFQLFSYCSHRGLFFTNRELISIVHHQTAFYSVWESMESGKQWELSQSSNSMGSHREKNAIWWWTTETNSWLVNHANENLKKKCSDQGWVMESVDIALLILIVGSKWVNKGKIWVQYGTAFGPSGYGQIVWDI